MFNVAAVYKIPHLKMVFFIVSDPDKSQTHHDHLQGNQSEKESIERIGIYEEHIWPNTPEQWKGLPISARDFLLMIGKMQPIGIKQPTQASTDLEKLSLLSITAIKPHFSYHDQLDNIKQLTYTSEEDVIEVFI